MKSEERRVKNSIALLIIKFKTQGNHKVQCSKFKVQSNMIKILNLKKIYNGNTVLDIDNLGVAKGELIGLVGNNGAGKTTLLRLILDLIQADDGFVESNLKKIYNGNTVLDIDNLGVAKGELIGLVGNNGAGKTTLLRLILDLIQADDGFVESNGQKVNESETWKEYTGSYIDGRFLIDFLTPEEYFDFIADVYHIDDETLQERLAQFEGFMHDEIMGTKKYLRDFSQGNRQKIGIIGAMIINPKVLLP